MVALVLVSLYVLAGLLLLVLVPAYLFSVAVHRFLLFLLEREAEKRYAYAVVPARVK